MTSEERIKKLEREITMLKDQLASKDRIIDMLNKSVETLQNTLNLSLKILKVID